MYTELVWEHDGNGYMGSPFRIFDQAGHEMENQPVYQVIGMTLERANEIQRDLDLEAARQQRDALLAETDWWAVADRTMTAEQTAYRQALRDITENFTTLDAVVWPTKP